MATEKDLEGLPRYDWRLAEGPGGQVVQRRVREKWDLDYTSPDNQDPLKLAEKLRAFGLAHQDTRVEIDHKFEDHPYYSCETMLELTGWRTATEDEVSRERLRIKGEQRTRDIEERRRLERQLEETRRRLGEL